MAHGGLAAMRTDDSAGIDIVAEGEPGLDEFMYSGTAEHYIPVPGLDLNLIPNWPRFTKEMIKKLAPSDTDEVDLNWLIGRYEGKLVSPDVAIDISDRVWDGAEDEILVDLNLVDQAQKGVKDYIKSQKFDGYGTYSTRDTYEVLHLPQIIEEAEKYISRGRTLYFKDGYTLDNEGLHPPVEGKAPITPFYWDTLLHDTI